MMAGSLPRIFKKSPYGLSVILLVFLLAIVMSPIFYFSFNYYALGQFIPGGNEGKKIYILRSKSCMDRLTQVGGDPENYEHRLQEINTLLADQGYVSKIISEDELQLLQADDTLFLIDDIATDDITLDRIDHFVRNGGSLVFNYYSGFSKSDGTWRGDAFVNKITGLSVDPAFAALKKQTDIFLTPKLLSPLTGYLTDGPLMSVVFYEDIPLYKTPATLHPDLYFTDWSQFATPQVMKSRLPLDISGAVWHGTYKKGSWVYFNFPANVFSSSGSYNEKYTSLLKGIADYAINGIVVRKHPYLTDTHPIMLSEDTEYKFENASGFSNLVQTLKIPSTAFCVSQLADKNPSIALELANNPYIEIGSHSYTHGEIIGVSDQVLNKEIKLSKQRLQSLTKRDVTGFRPPREEIDKAVIQKLIKSGYSYTMEKNQNQLYPKVINDNLVVIPRVGTDDYDYLAHYTFDEQMILDQMKKEQAFVSNLDGIYTLSVHTHLFSDPHNLHLLENFLIDIKGNDKLTFLQGRTIADRVRDVKNIDVKIANNNGNYVISVVNHNLKTIPKAGIRVYWPRWGAIGSMVCDTAGINFKMYPNQNERYTDIEIIDLKPKIEFSLLAEHNDAN